MGRKSIGRSVVACMKEDKRGIRCALEPGLIVDFERRGYDRCSKETAVVCIAVRSFITKTSYCAGVWS
jgi:hypothetical protein